MERPDGGDDNKGTGLYTPSAMAVYTKVQKPDLVELLSHYDIGELANYQGIEQGVENTNYILNTTGGKFILTLFEKRVDPVDLPFFFAFTDHLSHHKIPCPSVVRDRNGVMLRALSGRPSAIIKFLDGRDVDPRKITPAHCASLGRFLGKMHKAAQSLDQNRDNTLSLDGWRDMASVMASRADSVEPGLQRVIADEVLFLERHWPGPDSLPRAVIHADIFPDNVFFKGCDVCGVIDFYFSCTDFLAYDLAIIINAWCFDARGHILPKRLQELMAGYESVRKLNKQEKENLSVLCRGAALRFLLTRLNDWVFHPEGALVKPKDPLEYLEKLKWHQNHDLAEES